MLKRALIPLALAGAFALAPFTARTASAQADTPAATEPATAAPATAAPAPECTLKGQPIACEALAKQFSENPAEAISTVRSLWKSGGIMPAILLALFVALYAASKRISWLTKDKRAAWTASALGGLTVLAEPASRGTTPTLSMIIAALGAALLLFTNAGKPSTTTGDQSVS